MEEFNFKKRVYSVVLSGKIGNDNKLHLWTGFAYRLEDAELNARNTMQNIGSTVNDFTVVAHTQVDIEKVLEEYKKTVPQENRQSDEVVKSIVKEAVDKVVRETKEEPSERSKLMSKIIKGGKKEFDKHKDELTPVEQQYLIVKMKIK